jgi:hypothetical protein
MDTFARRLLRTWREGPASLVSLTVSKDQDLAQRAQESFLQMDDTIIRPVVDAASRIGIADRLWLTSTAVEAEVRLRRALVATLKKMLIDKTLLPEAAPAGAAEETSPPIRACDEAYLQLRALLHGAVNRDRFLQGTFVDRDKELRRFQTSRELTSFMPAR